MAERLRRVVVTGGAGFIGLHLVRRLVAEGSEVVVVDDFSRGCMDDELDAMAAHVAIVPHDLTQPLPDDALPSSADAVFHLAAVVGVRHSNENPGRVLRTNFLAAHNVLDWCRRRPPGVFFLSSTSEVGDGAAETGLATHPVSEAVPFVIADLGRSRSSYALSKAAGEMLALQHASEFPVRIARYHNIYGPRMGLAHVIPEFIERIVSGVEPFPIYGGSQTRAFCFIDDAVSATLALCRLRSPEPITANVGNDREEVPILSVAEHLFAMAGIRPKVVERGAPPGSPARRLPDLTRLRALIGFEPEVPLAVGLRKTFDWYAPRVASLAAAGGLR